MPILQKFIFPMRETMPFFVSSLRAVDDWKRIHAKRADAITQAEIEANAKYVKSPFARSMNIDDLLRFLDDTVLDINFMVQLPSIEKCLEKWWKLYARDKHAIDQDTLRNVYYDLAYVLVEAKTETIHKNSVSMIMRSSWTKWSPKEPPLGKSEFFRLLFILAHLMTTTDRLGEYVVFFQDTMSRISRKYYQKQIRAEQHSRRPRIRRKSTLEEILLNGKGSPPKMVSGRNKAPPATIPGASPTQRLNVQMGRIPTQTEASLSDDEDQAGDCFVELLERNARYQRVVVDPVMHDKRFQEKFKRPAGGVNGNTTSTNDILVALNPLTNKYFPPLLSCKLQTSASPGPNRNNILTRTTSAKTFSQQRLSLGQTETPGNQAAVQVADRIHKNQRSLQSPGIGKDQPLHSSKSTPTIIDAYSEFHVDDADREEELLRRSLSRVTVKKRVDKNKAAGIERLKNRGHEPLQNLPTKGPMTTKEDIYLAIST